MIDFKIIATGSKGNAVVINKAILIDCGVSFRALKDVYKDLRLVLLTHIHSDHFCAATIKKLARERPTLRFGCCEWLVKPLIDCGVIKSNIDVYTQGVTAHYGEVFAVEAFHLMHNVPNAGYKIFSGGKKLLYATDTNSMQGIEAKGYDLYMLEANYTESEIVDRIRHKQEQGEYCYEFDALNNHLSREKADNWLYANMDANSRYVYLHQHVPLEMY